MQPTSYPVSYDLLKQIWSSYMEAGQLDWEQKSIADPAILRSWRRCAIRLDPRAKPRPGKIRHEALKSVLRAQDQLISLATPFMEDIHQFMEGSDCAVLLADSTSCVHTVVGDPRMVQSLTEAGLAHGTYWSEGQLGTNAIGLAPIDAMPILVLGEEHFYSELHIFGSAAAPIHDVRGRIIGIIGLIGAKENCSPHALALAMASARAVSNQLQTDWFLDEANLHLTEVNTIIAAISEGVIAWDDSGRIHHTNAQAGAILGKKPSAIVGKRLEDVLTLPPELLEKVENNLEARDIETSFWVDEKRIGCLISLRPLFDGWNRPFGYIALLRPIEQVRRLVQQQIGADATLTLDDLVGETKHMHQVLRQARMAARGSAPVLLKGEGGVGKNLLARAIHNDSPSAGGPFIVIDCRAIPHELMVSEFLGQEQTIGSPGRPSKFELASGGTLLLDQIESLSLETQTLLLRVLETKHVMRLGASRPTPLDVRIVAATTSELQQAVSDGRFIPHLLYRFGVFEIEIPPLRERAEDIPLLVERFLTRIRERDHRSYSVDDQALDLLSRYPWPGNVREMESALERSINNSQDDIIQVVDLPESIRVKRVMLADNPQPLPVVTVADAEREAIIRAGWACQGRTAEMAQQLGISRTTLWRRMRKMNVSPELFRR